jgi:predicted MFS family arabinose efflux permease
VKNPIKNDKSSVIVLSALTLSRTSPQARALLTSLLLIEIGETFGTSIGVTNQINTINSVMAIIAALIVGIISIRYSYRSLLIAGLSLSIVSVLGCCYAPSFLTLLVIFSLGGFAANMIVPMTTALIGEHVPQDKRTQAMGWLMAGPAAIYIIGYPIGNIIGNWKEAYLFFAFPVSLIALILTMFSIPDTESRSPVSDSLRGYKEIFKNKSAIACLVGYALGLGVWTISLTMAASFYRTALSMSRTNVAYLTMAMAFAYIAGALIVNRVVSRMGSKKTTLVTAFLMGLSTMIRFSIPNMIFTVSMGFLTCFFAGGFSTANQGLNLDQMPSLRGSMMSLTSALGSVGTVVILGLSGVLLTQYGWAVMGLITGAFGLVAGVIFFLLVKE